MREVFSQPQEWWGAGNGDAILSYHTTVVASVFASIESLGTWNAVQCMYTSVPPEPGAVASNIDLATHRL